MAKSTEVVRQISRDWVREKVPFLTPLYERRRLEDEDEIIRARRMATLAFVELGKIPEKQVGVDGLLKHDSLLPMSTFFGTFRASDDELMATTRLLWRDDLTVDELRLPINDIKPEHAEYLRAHEPGQIAEIGSLAKKHGAETVAILHLLRSIWHHAAEQEVKTFVCGLEPKVYPHFVQMFGDAVVPLSDETMEFPGIKGQQRPLMIDVMNSVAIQDASEHASPVQRLGRRAIGRFITQDIPGIVY